ncbi:hypothetical protein FIBSPDRAFT_936395 [Athelia psychrophila]|uniref:Uncharacterized protein n=1 Tax=Athelia psychrophila TaxID=1759441 RepID=A0A166C6M3_9AGAM|nr:hypothetical protein FIBSPDRAFT_936395 [Fibularhizoctonia sp. CBS 109695]
MAHPQDVIRTQMGIHWKAVARRAYLCSPVDKAWPRTPGMAPHMLWGVEVAQAHLQAVAECREVYAKMALLMVRGTSTDIRLSRRKRHGSAIKSAAHRIAAPTTYHAGNDVQDEYTARGDGRLPELSSMNAYRGTPPVAKIQQYSVISMAKHLRYERENKVVRSLLASHLSNHFERHRDKTRTVMQIPPAPQDSLGHHPPGICSNCSSEFNCANGTRIHIRFRPVGIA